MRRLWRPVLDVLPLYDPGPTLESLAAELGRDGVVRLSANENPLGPSPRAVAAVEHEASRIHLYPDGGSLALRQAPARRPRRRRLPRGAAPAPPPGPPRRPVRGRYRRGRADRADRSSGVRAWRRGDR